MDPVGLGGLVVAALGLIYAVVRNVRRADLAKRTRIYELELDVLDKDNRIRYLTDQLEECREDRRYGRGR